MDAYLKIQTPVNDQNDVLETVERRVAAIIPDHGASFSFHDDNMFIIGLDDDQPAQKNCQIMEIANGALQERLHPCEI